MATKQYEYQIFESSFPLQVGTLNELGSRGWIMVLERESLRYPQKASPTDYLDVVKIIETVFMRPKQVDDNGETKTT